MSVLRALGGMARALIVYQWTEEERRNAVACPPHRYEQAGQTFPFCLDCGEYRDPA